MTRRGPLIIVWDFEILAMLEEFPVFRAETLFCELMRSHMEVDFVEL